MMPFFEIVLKCTLFYGGSVNNIGNIKKKLYKSKFLPFNFIFIFFYFGLSMPLHNFPCLQKDLVSYRDDG